MAAKIIDGKAIAARVRAEVAQGVAEVAARAGLPPGLAAVRVGEDPASVIYVRNKIKACKEAGLESFEHALPERTSQEEVWLPDGQKQSNIARVVAVLEPVALRQDHRRRADGGPSPGSARATRGWAHPGRNPAMMPRAARLARRRPGVVHIQSSRGACAAP